MYLYLDLSEWPWDAELLFDCEEAPPRILVSLSLWDFWLPRFLVEGYYVGATFGREEPSFCDVLNWVLFVSKKLSRLDYSSYSILLENTFLRPLGLKLPVDLATSIMDCGKFKISFGSAKSKIKN